MHDLTTTWGDALLADPDAIPWPEHPRPDLKRERWRTLNGPWRYAVTPAGVEEPGGWEGDLRVPFPIESRLSGVGRPLEPGETLWCERSFELDQPPAGRLRLHFDAVDHDCRVWVNGEPLGSHRGGNLPFALDATAAARAGENAVRVAVRDETGGFQLKGKQKLDPEKIFYTRVSGIWQSVWLEWVPEVFIERLAVEARCDGTLRVTPAVAGGPAVAVRVTASLDGREVAHAEGEASVQLRIPEPRRWSPESPTLYGLRVELLSADGGTLDAVDSHAGLREIGQAPGPDGRPRITLNGEPVFHFGPLDQGWWPDGLLTPPSHEAMVSDLKFLKAAGFNAVRKHVKVEPAGFYHACDELGLLVWQDQPSGGPSPDWVQFRNGPDAPRPPAGPPPEADWPEDEHAFWQEQWAGLIDHLDGHPSVAVWVPFNERWGQHRSEEVGRWTVKRDPSRLTNLASGGNFFPVGHVADAHRYPEPWFDFEDARYDGLVAVVGEFGGHGLPVPGHLWEEGTKSWGYGELPSDADELEGRYRASIQTLAQLRDAGLSGGVYTQTTDVEIEINGLLTYDRRVQKISAETLRAIHADAGFCAEPARRKPQMNTDEHG